MSDPISNFNFVEGVNLNDSSFTPDQITQVQEMVRQYLEDGYQNLDFSPVSGLHDSVIRPSSQIMLLARGFIEEYNKSRTLYDALNNDGNEAIVDAILSNFLVSRRPGSKTTGTIRISVENYAVGQRISTIDPFTTPDGLKFFAQMDYTATNTPTNIGEVEIFQSNTGSSGYFMVDVVAENVGEVYNIKKNSQFEYTGSMDGLISAVALDQFTGGESNETNQSVYNRIISSLSARNMTSALAIDQSLKDSFPSTVTTSSHGVSSEYMKRNAHNVFGVKSGCFCDVYVKNSYAPKIKEICTIASKIVEGDELAGSNNEYVGKFQVSISKDDFPGHYDVLTVRPVSANKIIGSYEVVKKIRKITDIQAQNEFYTVPEAAFTRYSSTDVIFTEYPSSGLDEISVACEVSGLYDIDSMQSFANGPDSKTALIDILIKACVPCFISIEPITVRVTADSTLTPSAIVSEITSYILGLDPSHEQLRADIIVAKISALSGVVGVDLPIRINASILAPSENPETIDESTISTLVIPTIPSKFVGPETVGLFVKDGSINVNIIKVL